MLLRPALIGALCVGCAHRPAEEPAARSAPSAAPAPQLGPKLFTRVKDEASQGAIRAFLSQAR